MAVLHVKSATSNANLDTVGTKDDDTDPYGLQAAFDNVAAGDEIRIWADGTYTVGTQVDINTTSGTVASPVTVTGANSAGVVDETKATIQATSAIAALFALGSSIANYVFQHLILDANSNATNAWSSTSTANDRITFFRCRFTNATNDGVIHRSDYCRFILCEIDNNGDVGIEVAFRGAAQRGLVIGCKIHGNAGDGVFVDNEAKVHGCLIYGNGGNGLVADMESQDVVIINNTFYGNAGDGASFRDLIGCTIMNNSFVSNGAYGLDLGSAALIDAEIEANHYHNNTSGPAFLSAAILSANINSSNIGLNNITGDPLFADPANGDFTPGAGSPLLNAGIDVTDL